MEQIYYAIGKFVFWFAFTIGAIYLSGQVFKVVVNYIASRYKMGIVMLEYAYYRAAFLKWVKDKNRYPNLK